MQKLHPTTRSWSEMKVLCVAGNETTQIVIECVAALGLCETVCSPTVAKAHSIWNASDQEFIAVVAALGATGTDLLFDTTTVDGTPTSSLITAVTTLTNQSCTSSMIVFSHTACGYIETKQLCLAAGADAVLCSKQHLTRELNKAYARLHNPTVPPTLMPTMSAPPTPIPRARTSNVNHKNKNCDLFSVAEESTLLSPATHLPPSPTPLHTPVVFCQNLDPPDPLCATVGGFDLSIIEKRKARDAVLGSKDSKEITACLEEQIKEASKHIKFLYPQKTKQSTSTSQSQSPLPSPSASLTQSVQQTVRIVHVSDTHNHHDRLVLPDGDLLVHTGDFVGNYHEQDIDAHFHSCLAWLQVAACKYNRVMFIGGNHDTMLDERKAPNQPRARNLIKELIKKYPNIDYLENSGAEFRGLQIWGSPTCICREEALGKRYISNAFERSASERRNIWSAMPPNVDILLSHVPPYGVLNAWNETIGCKQLSKYV